MKSFFDVLKTMFYRKNAKSYGTPDRSRKEPVTQQKVQIRNTETRKAAPSLKENEQHNRSERTNSKVDKGMDKEDFLLKQIDEFREKAKAILKEFRTVYQENGKPSGRRYTKGHFKRGAE